MYIRTNPTPGHGLPILQMQLREIECMIHRHNGRNYLQNDSCENCASNRSAEQSGAPNVPLGLQRGSDVVFGAQILIADTAHAIIACADIVCLHG